MTVFGVYFQVVSVRQEETPQSVVREYFSLPTEEFKCLRYLYYQCYNRRLKNDISIEFSKMGWVFSSLSAKPLPLNEWPSNPFQTNKNNALIENLVKIAILSIFI